MKCSDVVGFGMYFVLCTGIYISLHFLYVVLVSKYFFSHTCVYLYMIRSNKDYVLRIGDHPFASKESTGVQSHKSHFTVESGVRDSEDSEDSESFRQRDS